MQSTESNFQDHRATLLLIHPMSISFFWSSNIWNKYSHLFWHHVFSTSHLSGKSELWERELAQEDPGWMLRSTSGNIWHMTQGIRQTCGETAVNGQDSLLLWTEDQDRVLWWPGAFVKVCFAKLLQKISHLATALAAVNPRVILSQVEQGEGAPQDGQPPESVSFTSVFSKRLLASTSSGSTWSLSWCWSGRPPAPSMPIVPLDPISAVPNSTTSTSHKGLCHNSSGGHYHYPVLHQSLFATQAHLELIIGRQKGRKKRDWIFGLSGHAQCTGAAFLLSRPL